MNPNVMFSSKSEIWETPIDFFEELDREFHFQTDVCALPENKKCAHYYSPEPRRIKTEVGRCLLVQSSLWEKYREMGKKSR